jgi:ADP-heptose:LPS heptosyltransferase
LTKVLIIRFSSIGDIVLTTPVVRCLKEQLYGGAEIHYLTKRSFEVLLTPNVHITKVYSIEKSTNEVMEALRAEAYDYIIDLHHNLRSARVKHALQCMSFSFRKLNAEKWLLVNFGIDRLPRVHIVQRYLDTLKAFGITDDGRGLDFFFPAGYTFPERGLPPTHRQGFVAVVMAAAHWRKKPRLAQYIEICDRLKQPIVLLGGKAEMAEASEVLSRTGGHVYDATGRYDLYGSAWLVGAATLVITPDTGLMHIAAALQKPIISIWGATVPAFGMYPYRNNALNAMVEADHLKRRPCSKLGTRCKYRECRCIDELPVDRVCNLALKALRESRVDEQP